MNTRLCCRHIDSMSTSFGLALQKKAISPVFSEDGFSPDGGRSPELNSRAADSTCASPFIAICF